MHFSLELRPLAVLEIVEAADWYTEQKAGLGDEFLAEMDLFFDTVLHNPFTYSFFDEPVREGRIHRFPYKVVYEVFDKKIVIYTVFMARQNPGKKRTF